MYIRDLSVLLVFGLLALVQAGNRRVQEVDADFLELVKAKDLIAKGVEKRGHEGSCNSYPCKNGGQCVHIPSEFQSRLGLDYHCVCRGDYGGFFCEIPAPCSTCPSSAYYCARTAKDQTGRYCYDRYVRIVVDSNDNSANQGTR